MKEVSGCEGHEVACGGFESDIEKVASSSARRRFLSFIVVGVDVQVDVDVDVGKFQEF